jgi:hypothetical protein
MLAAKKAAKANLDKKMPTPGMRPSSAIKKTARETS